MKENLLDVLIGLFQNGIDDEVDLDTEHEAMEAGLLFAGLPAQQIQQAVAWLDHLVARQPVVLPISPQASRIYVGQEQDKLNVECRGFLLFLEQSGVLHPETRELVIDQVMMLDTDEMDLHQLKWIILMALFNQPDQEDTCAWLESWVFNDALGRCLH